MICPLCRENVEDPQTHSTEICRRRQWRAICPPLYFGTEVERLPKNQYAEAMAWQYGQRGLLFAGPTGQCKTRIAYEVVKREHLAGKRVQVFDCTDFGHQCARRFSEGEGEAWIERMARRDIVFFDDIDKSKFTERVESELFGLIEKRIARCLPIIATTQLKGKEFGSKFNDSVKGEAIVRRLREFCTAIAF